jgi:hypothetical protein
VKGLHAYRKQAVRKPLGRLALPDGNRFLPSQMGGLTPGALARLPAIALEPIQNPDGTFKLLLGTGGLGDGTLS